MNAQTQKDRSGFKDFFTNEYGKLINYVHKYLDTNVYGIDPEDIVQDIALKIFEKIDFNNPIENIAAYVFRAIRNQITDYQRKPDRDIPMSHYSEHSLKVILKDLIDEIADIEDENEKSELKHKMFRSIEMLKPDQRAILFETEFEGTSFEELSERWNVPIGTLLSRKHRAIVKLKELMN